MFTFILLIILLSVSVEKVYLYEIIEKDKNDGNIFFKDSSNENKLLKSGTRSTNKLWSLKSSIPTGRRGLAVVELNGTIYALGGYNDNKYLQYSTVEAYNPINDSWFSVKSMKISRASFSAVVVNGTIFAINGGSGSDKTVESYNPSTNTWKFVASSPTSHQLGTSSVVNGIIYTIGGWFFKKAVNAYNPKNNTWWKVASLPIGMQGMTSSVLNGEIYVIGGAGSTNKIYKYNPVKDKWYMVKNMLTGRQSPGAITHNNQIYVIGGGTQDEQGITGGIKEMEIYNSSSNSWKYLPSMTYGRWGLGVTVYNNTIYAVGGAYGFIPIKIYRYNEAFLIPDKPWCDDIKFSILNVNRTNQLKIFVNGTDIEDPENSLLCYLQYKAPSDNWTNLTNKSYINNRWVFSFTPNITSELGFYNFRARFKDTDGNYSNWFEVIDKVHIINNYPIVNDIKFSTSMINRTDTFKIFVNGSDLEDSENKLNCNIQYRTSIGNWTNLTGEIFKNNRWEIIFYSNISSETGYYDFRFRFTDTDGNYSNWVLEFNKIFIKNNAPIALNLSFSRKNVLRINTIKIYANGLDIETNEELLICKVQFKSPSGNWMDINGGFYNNNRWELNFTPLKNFQLGFYDFRVKFTDKDNLNSSWLTYYQVIKIKNNIPIFENILFSSNSVFRMGTIKIFINGTDVETSENKLIYKIQYREKLSNWTNLTGVEFVNDHMEINFIPLKTSKIGFYDFRFKLFDIDNDSCDWQIFNNKIFVKNNIPIVNNLHFSSLIINRTDTIKIITNGTDVETLPKKLIFEIQYKPPTGNWTHIENKYYISDHWEVTFTPKKNFELGIYDFRTRFIDSDGNFSNWLNRFNYIKIQNNYPQIIITDKLKILEDNYYENQYMAIDIETENLSWTFKSNASWLIWNSENQILNGTSQNMDVGQYLIIINVTDIDGGFDTHIFTLIVENKNPSIITNDINIAFEDLYFYNDYNSDDDGQGCINWKLSSNAKWLDLACETGILSGIPTNNDVGSYWVNVNVSDGNGGFDETNFTLTVINKNDFPEINNSLPDLWFKEDSINYNINLNKWFKDIDGDILTYSFEGNKDLSVTILENNSVKLIPKTNWNGFEVLTFYANDSFSEISDDIKITILPINDAPTNAIIILAEMIYYEDYYQPAIGNATDVDILYGDELTFTWYSNITDKIGVGQNINLSLPTGMHTIVLNVTDKAGAWCETSTVIEIFKLPKDKNGDDKVDSDNDNYLDEIDIFPNDPTQWLDSDGDNFGDNLNGTNPDLFPYDPTQWFDTDGDNIGDNPNGINPDSFPNDPTQWLDSDGDNYGDNPNGTNPDAFPNDPTRWKKEGESTDKKKPDDKKGENSIWIIIGATMIFIVILILIFFLIIKRKKKGEVELERQPASEIEKEIQQQLSQQPHQQIQPTVQPQQPIVQLKPQQQQIQPTIQPQQKNCSTCGLSLKYYQQNNRYYCHNCKKYK